MERYLKNGGRKHLTNLTIIISEDNDKNIDLKSSSVKKNNSL